MKQMRITNDRLKELIFEFEKKSEEKGSNLLGRVSDDLKRPRRIRREVNLTRINQHTEEGEVVIVPGKVLGGGAADHKITISAFRFSGSALSKIEKTGSKVIPLNKLANESIKGKKIRIIG